MVGDISVVFPALHDDFVSSSMEKRVGEEFSPFVNQAVDNFLGLGVGNVELTCWRLDCVPKVRLGVEARSNLRDTYTAEEDEK